ncbi:unnamed protein product, partial [Brassica rapa subsp. trilocularis]
MHHWLFAWGVGFFSIVATVSSTCPLAFPIMTLCLLAAASVGSGQLRYKRVASLRSCRISSSV